LGLKFAFLKGIEVEFKQIFLGVRRSENALLAIFLYMWGKFSGNRERDLAILPKSNAMEL